MRETTFIQRNQDRWQQLENVIANIAVADPQVLADAYVSLSDDLAFAQAQFPDSSVNTYLNQLLSRVHVVLLRSRKERVSRLKRFWVYDVPQAMSEIRFEIAIVATILVFTAAIGFLGGLQSQDLARNILGDSYVDMTIMNIEGGDPMGVYKQDPWNMFFGIGFNNFAVMLRSVAMGLIPVVGVGFIAAYHGVMIGSFHALFAQYDVLGQSLLTVYIHGAMEMSLLVIAGAAGLSISFSFLHPGTYTRLASFKRSTRRAAYVAVGCIPFIGAAAALESFVTRLTWMPSAISLSIIALTFAAIWMYALYLPRYNRKRESHV